MMNEVDIPYPEEVIELNEQLAELWDGECMKAHMDGLDDEREQEVIDAVGVVWGRILQDRFKWGIANAGINGVDK
jgi:hypothetical protein